MTHDKDASITGLSSSLPGFLECFLDSTFVNLIISSRSQVRSKNHTTIVLVLYINDIY